MSETGQVASAVNKLQHATIVGVAVHNADFLLAFGVMVPTFNKTGLASPVSLEPVANITLSPPAVKQLMRQLARAIEAFEQATGVAIPQMGEISETAVSRDE